MRQSIWGFLVLCVGFFIGLPAGYFFHAENNETVQSNSNDLDSNELQLTFKRDYFENLPKAPGTETRLMNVGTFTFDTNGDGSPEPDTAITIPLLGMNDIPDSQKSRVFDVVR